MKTSSELLLGTWISDPEDIESIRKFGNVKLHFTEDGQLIYSLLSEQKKQKMFLTYRVENNILITDQPSAPRKKKLTSKLPMMTILNGNVQRVRRHAISAIHHKII